MATIDKLFLSYAVIAILTFGIAYNRGYEEFENHLDSQFFNMFRAAFCGIAWPVYLSTEVFSGLRP